MKTKNSDKKYNQGKEQKCQVAIIRNNVVANNDVDINGLIASFKKQTVIVDQKK